MWGKKGLSKFYIAHIFFNYFSIEREIYYKNTWVSRFCTHIVKYFVKQKINKSTVIP